MHCHLGAESGENVTLKDSADITFKKLQISGNTWQDTREGYNLLNVNKNYSLNGSSTITYDKPIPAGTTITISWDSFAKGGENNPAIDFREASNTPFRSVVLSNDTNKYTITLEKDAKFSRIYSNRIQQ